MIAAAPAPVELITIPRTRPTQNEVMRSAQACRAAAALGVSLDTLRMSPSPPPALGLNVAPGAVTLITGHSGSGKSSMLRDIRRVLSARHWRVVRPLRRPLPERPCIELLSRGDSHIDAMRRLARAGLGDARCFVRTPGMLSDGERARLRLARAMWRASRCAVRGERVVLILDEFGTGLDTITARSVATLVRRFVRDHPDVVVVVATTRDDVTVDLRPDAHIHLGPAPGPRPTVPLAEDVVIEAGDRSDYLSLAAHHYRPELPATIVHTLVAWHRTSGAMAGVLTVSMPTRNGGWRRAWWPDVHGSARLGRLNDTVRCISRVIVEPRFRALGLAARLVRKYLREPLTPRTEAIAAMGRACPFFAHAGMTAVHRPPSARHARLRDAFVHAGIRSWELADATHALKRVQDSRWGALLESELRRWANDSGVTRHLVRATLDDLLHVAAPSVTCTPVAYVHEIAETKGECA